MAESTDARLFDNFPDADACVVITRPDEFKVRIRSAVSTQLPGWKLLARPVIYLPRPGNLWVTGGVMAGIADRPREALDGSPFPRAAGARVLCE
jgi:hypothetical protein